MTIKSVTFNLSEHDARRLLELVKAQAKQDDETWRVYWNRLGITIADQIGLAYLGVYANHQAGAKVSNNQNH